MDHYAAGWKITIAAALEMFLHLDAMAKIYLTFLRRICAIYIYMDVEYVCSPIIFVIIYMKFYVCALYIFIFILL